MTPTLEQQIEALWWLLTAKGYNKSFKEPVAWPAHRLDFEIQLARPIDHTVTTFCAPTKEEVLGQVIAYRIAERLDG